MKKEKTTSTLFYITSVLFYLAAIIGFAAGSDRSSAVVWLCLGSSFLCLGTVYRNKAAKGENDDKK